jgi:hypothetical protein
MEINNSSQRLRIFLCHASTDKEPARILYHVLDVDGLEPWLDEKRLVPGQDWQLEIKKAVTTSHIVIVILSKHAVAKTGFVQKEIRYALDVAEEQPESTIFIIPLRLEPCDVPKRLSQWQWVDLFERNGIDHLMKAIRLRAESVGISIKVDSSLEQVSTVFNPDNFAYFSSDTRWLSVGEIFSLIANQKFEESEAKLETYLNERPDEYDVLFYCTQDLSQRCGRKEQVIKLLDKKIDEIRTKSPVWAGRILKIRAIARLGVGANHQERANQLSKAEEDFLLSVQLNPAVSESHFHLACINTLRGNLPAADIYFEQAVRTCTDEQFKIVINKVRHDARNNPSRFISAMKDVYSE